MSGDDRLSEFVGRVRNGLLGAFVATVFAVSATVPASAQEASFEGMQVDAITPTGPGGSGDAYLRYLERFFARHLPGNPTVLVQNREGGGSLIGMNWFHANPRPDGSHFLLVGPSGRLTYLLDQNNPNVQFEPSEWRAFLASPMGRVTYVSASTGIEGVEDLRDFDGEFIMGIQSATGTDMPSLFSFDALGVTVRPVFGSGGGDNALAFERGEFNVNTDVTSGWMIRGPEMVAAGEAIPLYTFGFENENGEIVRDPNFPELPTWLEAYEIIHGTKPEGPLYEAWLALFRNVTMSSRALALSQGTSDDVYNAYVEASDAILNDPEFVETHAEFLGTYPQVTGEQAQNLLAGSMQFSDAAREHVADWLMESYGVDIR